jgi:quercetin dioxygenase-like cupin family protein
MPKDYPVVNVEDVAPEGVREKDGWKQMDIRFLITRKRQGSTNCIMWRVIFTPDAQHKRHRHINSDELFYIIRGHAVSSVDGKEYVVGSWRLSVHS